MTGYCPAHDPILAAGFLLCPSCGRRSYPADAEWVGTDLVIASWQRGCSHIRLHVMLVRPSLLEPCDEPEPERGPCQATVRHGRRRGERCLHPAVPGTGYCYFHADESGDPR